MDLVEISFHPNDYGSNYVYTGLRINKIYPTFNNAEKAKRIFKEMDSKNIIVLNLTMVDILYLWKINNRIIK